MPKVSFLVPCFEQWEYLSVALASIKAQTFTDHETILVCETFRNWPDELPPVDKIIWHKENIGLAAARTSALRLSDSKFVVPLDADDWIELDFLEKTLALADNKWSVAVSVNGRAVLNQAILENNYLPYCALFDREVLMFLHGWKQPHPTIQGMEDWDLWIRLWHSGYAHDSVPDHLFNWNRHPDSMSSKFEGTELYGVLKDAVMRKNGL